MKRALKVCYRILVIIGLIYFTQGVSRVLVRAEHGWDMSFHVAILCILGLAMICELLAEISRLFVDSPERNGVKS